MKIKGSDNLWICIKIKKERQENKNNIFNKNEDLLPNSDKIYTTEMGRERIVKYTK